LLNPVYDRLMLQCDRELNSSTHIGIYDLNGRVVLEGNLDRMEAGISDLPLNVSLLKDGLYVYRIRSGNLLQKGKIVKISR
jgi:hypothetical protein